MLFYMPLLLYLALWMGPMADVLAFSTPAPIHRRRDNIRLYGLLEEASEMGGVDLSDLKLPEMSDLKLPEMSLPSMEIPSMEALDVPNMDIKALGNIDVNLVLPIVGVSAVLLLGLMAAASSSNKDAKPSGAIKKSKKTKAYSLAIPYHAPAQLAYKQWIEAHPDYSWDDAAYKSFQTLFESHAVAEATAKKLKRDMQNFANEPLPEPQPRRISKKTKVAKATKASGDLFFASNP